MSKIEPILSVKEFSVEFPSGDGRFTAVNDISFNIGTGEVIALVGESGSGKTVTGLSAMGLIGAEQGATTTGSFEYHNAHGTNDLLRMTQREFTKIRGKEIGMIFQEPMNALNPGIRCGEQISESMRQHLGLNTKQARARTIEILDEVGVNDPEAVYRKFPVQISGGQKQRVLIAMAIACNPRLLIADEPTTALDAGVKRKVLQKIKQVKDKYGLSMLFITHDLDLAAQIADRVFVMYAGKIVEQGSISEIFDHPKHPYTKGLINCRPPKSERYYFLPTIDDFMRLSFDGQNMEQNTDVQALLRGLRISETDRFDRHQRIYHAAPLLKVNGLSKSFQRPSKWYAKSRQVKAIDNVSLELFPGETLGVVGESGCGKTTLAKCIIGLHQDYEGEVLFKDKTGYNKIDQLIEVGKRVQYIFQDPYASLDPRMTIGKSLMEPLQLYKQNLSYPERYKMIIELLAQVGLKPYHYDRYPREFSGGQRQRICIARALLLEPEVLICDEAVSSLDVSVQAQVLNLLNELKYEYNLSYIFISHDLDVVRFMSDRIMVMNRGKMVEIGESDALFIDPQDSFTQSLMA